jgi:hypothetical protein
MKKLNLSILALLLIAISYAQEPAEKSKKLHVEINYFHRTTRCKTCLSIQDNIQKVLDQDFANEVKSGKLSFHLIDFQEMSDTAKINKYSVEDPKLVITKFKKGKEKTKDLTDFAFDNSLHNGKVFRDGFRDELNEMFR